MKHYYTTPDGEGVIELDGSLTTDEHSRLVALGCQPITAAEARRVAMALYADHDPIHEYPDIPGWYCSLCHSRSYDPRSGVTHCEDCQLLIVENWSPD